MIKQREVKNNTREVNPNNLFYDDEETPKYGDLTDTKNNDESFPSPVLTLLYSSTGADADEMDEDEDYDDDDNLADKSSTETDAQDLLVVNEIIRKAELDEGDIPATVIDVQAEMVEEGQYGPWVKATIVFETKDQYNNSSAEVKFVANRSLNPKSRLFPIVKGIMGKTPEPNFDLRNLLNKRVMITIKHNQDEIGNVWENVVSVRPLR